MLTVPELSYWNNFKVAMIKYCRFKSRSLHSEFW